jgi:hypothetical protein
MKFILKWLCSALALLAVAYLYSGEGLAEFRKPAELTAT